MLAFSYVLSLFFGLPGTSHLSITADLVTPELGLVTHSSTHAGTVMLCCEISSLVAARLWRKTHWKDAPRGMMMKAL